MQFKRAILVICVICLTIGSYLFMNRNYDSLSRYPYGTSEERALIKKYLDEREIKYIIDYSIDPVYFIRYCTYPGFLAYHIDYYNKAAQHFYFLNDYEIVDVVERLLDKHIDMEWAYNEYAYHHYDGLIKELTK